MRQTLLVKIAESGRVLPLYEFLLTKPVFPFSYTEIEEEERRLLRIARRVKRRDAYLVIASDNYTFTSGEEGDSDPFLKNVEVGLG